MFAKIATGGLLAAAVLTMAACGSSSNSGSSGGPNSISIYSSLPLQGSSAAQTIPLLNGEKLALSQVNYKIGQWTVNFKSLDDATAQAGKWDPNQVEANAKQAATDQHAVLYIGEFDSDASEVSIPILNEAGIGQVSPSNTYVGLTTSEVGSQPGEPQKYYPTGRRTFLRIVPRDTVQAAAAMSVMGSSGCSRVAMANDQSSYGSGLAAQVQKDSGRFGVTIVSNTGVSPTASTATIGSYAQTAKSQGANCFYYAGRVSNGGVALTKAVSTTLPAAKLFGGDAVCTSTFTNVALGGLPANAATRFQCTIATADVSAYPGGPAFAATYKAQYGVAPGPWSIFGYEAMKLGLDTIASLGPKGNNRFAVVTQLFKTTARSSVLGKYSISSTGDTTLKTYGVFNVGADGNPTYERAVAV